MGLINERIKKIETWEESFEDKNKKDNKKLHADTLQQAQVHTNDKICDEKDRAQEALEAVRDELDDNIKNLGEEHTAFVNDQYNPKVAHLSKRIDIRKSNADKILEAGASAVPHTFFAELKNNAKKCGSGRCADDTNGDKTCTDHYEKTFGQCNCGSQWIEHKKAMYHNPRREMKPLEESEEAKETEPEHAGDNPIEHEDDPSVKPAEESTADNGETPSDESSHTDDRSKRRLATAELTPSEKALRRRRLSNHPKSHIVVLERLMEEINRLN